MYDRPITRAARTAFIISLDLSGSMSESSPAVNGAPTKAEMVSRTVNLLLYDLIERARRGDRIHDYYDIAVIGYSGEGVVPLLDDMWFLSVDRLGEIRPKRRKFSWETAVPGGGTIFRQAEYPCWIDVRAEGRTPLYEALCTIRSLTEQWCGDPRNRSGFPPTIFNITDGEASDACEPEIRSICDEIRRLGTNDGNALLLNIHLSTHPDSPAILFPTEGERKQMERYARMLFDCSSPMPETLEPHIRMMRHSAEKGPFRGMSYNCSLHEIVSILNIGSNSRGIQ